VDDKNVKTLISKHFICISLHTHRETFPTAEQASRAFHTNHQTAIYTN